MSRGKTENFSPEQARVLMQVAAKLREENSWSQADLGERLGIGQQSAGRIERTGGANFTNARKLVRLAGFPHLDAAFEAYGVDGTLPILDDPWPNRRDAARFALAAGIPEHIIQSVKEKYADTLYNDRSLKWWGGKFHQAYGAELSEQAELRDVAERKGIAESKAEEQVRRSEVVESKRKRKKAS